MSQVSLYTQAGKKDGTIELDSTVFDVASNNALVHQVYHAIEANARQAWAKTKDRSEVRGGGKKPWKQKGTGRARHGSNRSPIWSGGGVTFGPLSERNYKQKINKKMNRQAVRVSISEKVRSEAFRVLKSVESTGKTKEFVALKDAMKLEGGSVLMIVADANDIMTRAIRNVPRFNMVRAIDLNVVDLLHHKHILATSDATKVLTNRLGA